MRGCLHAHPNTGLGVMDELEAAAAVLAMSRDDFAEEEVEQRAPCAERSGSAAGTMAAEAMEVDKENIQVDAASREVEDAIKQRY